jgi:hypothetical protein
METRSGKRYNKKTDEKRTKPKDRCKPIKNKVKHAKKKHLRQIKNTNLFVISRFGNEDSEKNYYVNSQKYYDDSEEDSDDSIDVRFGCRCKFGN